MTERRLGDHPFAAEMAASLFDPSDTAGILWFWGLPMREAESLDGIPEAMALPAVSWRCINAPRVPWWRRLLRRAEGAVQGWNDAL